MDDRARVLEAFGQAKELTDAKISEGIERHRKGDCRITVIDSEGKAVKNAVLSVKQQNHEFRFGANIFMLDQLETEEKNERYKKYFSDAFNMATLPFYWDTLEPERGKPRYGKDSPDIYRRPPIDRCIEFCEAHGIEPREHALAYEHFFPKWLSGASDSEVIAALEKRCAEIAERYASKIPTIEVTNEMCWDKGVTDFYDNPDFIKLCFDIAARYFPDSKLGINEYTVLAWEEHGRTSDKYYSYIEANLLKGAKIDAIGMQYHLFYRAEELYKATRKLLDPDCLYRHMELYSRFGKPLQVTEVTVPSYSWEAEDEELQARIIERLYSVWFSHPSVEQIIYWNLVDGYAHVPDATPETVAFTQGNMTVGENYYHGGLLRFDLTPKPAYHRLKRLIKETWHTEEQLCTDENGAAEFRGFYG